MILLIFVHFSLELLGDLWRQINSEMVQRPGKATAGFKLNIFQCLAISQMYQIFGGQRTGHFPIFPSWDTQGLQSPTSRTWLGLNLAKSTSLATRRKVANHSPWTTQGKQTSSKDIWSGGFPFLSNTFTHFHPWCGQFRDIHICHFYSARQGIPRSYQSQTCKA
jgi:hypothetical protein